MEKIIIVISLVVLVSMLLAIPVSAQGPDKNEGSIAPGLYKATRNHCCNPGQNGPANASAVFEAKYGFTHRW